MKKLSVIFMAMIVVGSAVADDAAAIKAKLQELERRVDILERALNLDNGKESRPSAGDSLAGIQALKRKAFEARERKDLKQYGENGQEEVVRLYQAYAKSDDVETRELQLLMKKYPLANRTGCAVLYAGQRDRHAGEKWLNLAIEKYSDCYYGDGVCVGAFARYCLAELYYNTGREKAAAKLISEIKARYPDALSHNGKLLSEYLK